ncbi:uncharacterized protein LOC143297514 [Babylonia areolata]|uniref:uncharacterized protein LOC143297514 n=1 Tax=Babylonia areolata TaxID=304850 RepID=UPI003FD6AF39
MLATEKLTHLSVWAYVTLCTEPTFDMPVVNVTVTEKETAVLPCSVRFLGMHQVVWTDQSSTLLTFEDRRIIDDERLSLERPFSKDWNLHIRDVEYKDQGVYNCQVNTVPVKIKTVNLIVEVPAKIIEHLSTENLVVRENEKVTLVCNVTGVPVPEVTWYRHISDQKGVEKQKVGVSGEVLIIHNITRYCGGTYECVAFNGVPPAVTHLIQVSVEFAPEIYLPNKRIGQDMGRETILECTVTAFPHAVSMWTRNGEKISTLSQKYRLEIYEEEQNSITLSLRIFSIERHDYGVYICMASNTLGEDSESMSLYEYSAYTKTTTTTPRMPRRTTTTTEMIPLRPPSMGSVSETSRNVDPLKPGRGHHSRPQETYRTVTWVPRQAGRGEATWWDGKNGQDSSLERQKNGQDSPLERQKNGQDSSLERQKNGQDIFLGTHDIFLGTSVATTSSLERQKNSHDIFLGTSEEQPRHLPWNVRRTATTSSLERQQPRHLPWNVRRTATTSSLERQKNSHDIFLGTSAATTSSLERQKNSHDIFLGTSAATTSSLERQKNSHDIFLGTSVATTSSLERRKGEKIQPSVAENHNSGSTTTRCLHSPLPFLLLLLLTLVLTARHVPLDS